MARTIRPSDTDLSPNPELRSPQHWGLLVYGGDRSYAGNPGYADIPSEQYHFDSSVPNHKRLRDGDIVAIRTRTGIEGFARIASISSSPGERARRECPVCAVPRIKERRNSSPRFRCRNGHEFDEFVEKTAPCTLYVADFAGSFVRLEHPLSSDVAVQMRRNRNAQQFSIQPADFRLVDASCLPEQVREWIAARVIAEALAAEDADAAVDDLTCLPDESDARNAVLRQIRQRRGQRAFRDQLLAVFGARCAVTGCAVADLLEAAHIHPYRGPQDNHPGNGLLLRADVHTLFDLHPSRYRAQQLDNLLAWLSR